MSHRLVRSAVLLVLLAPGLAAASSLRFHGNGVAAPDLDRVKIAVDDVGNTDPGPPADLGATDFTIEFWMKAAAADNTAGAVACGSNVAWINGNIVVDRDRFSQGRKFGLSLANGRVVFGVSTDSSDRTVCGSADVLDDAWHHVAVTRDVSSGDLSVWVDGALDASSSGPAGDLSYPDDGIPCSNCCGGGNCDFSDPYLVLGAEKHDAGASYPSYSGFLDEVRLSTVIRYAAPFTPPSAPFATDADTAALYHLDEGSGDVIGDSSGAAGGPSDGERRFGGTPAGPEWSAETPFGDPADLDGDGKANEDDECTVLVASQRMSRARLDLKGLDVGAGGQSIGWKGEFRPAGPWVVDPAADGLRLRIADHGAVMLDVDVPPGLVGASPSTPCDARDGWTMGGSPSSPSWQYRNYSGFLDAACTVGASGITLVKVADLTASSSPRVKFQMKASGTTFPAEPTPLFVEAAVALGARTAPPLAGDSAGTGACGEAAWDPVTFAKPAPYCRATTSRLLCVAP